MSKNYKHHTPAQGACEAHQSNAWDSTPTGYPRKHERSIVSQTWGCLLPPPSPLYLLSKPTIFCSHYSPKFMPSLCFIWLEGLQLSSKHSMYFTSVKCFQLPDSSLARDLGNVAYSPMSLVTSNAERVTMITCQVPGRVPSPTNTSSYLSLNNNLKRMVLLQAPNPLSIILRSKKH